MQVLDLTVRRKAATDFVTSVPDSGRSWFSVVREGFPGAWQQNVEVRIEDVIAFPPLQACLTLIAGDIAKMRVKLMRQDADGIWSETYSPAFSPFLQKPNHYQNRIQFWVSWVLSKLIHGNTYVLKQRDKRDVVVGGHVLDACRVKVLVAADGQVYYALYQDNLAALQHVSVIVPATEIMHDVYAPLYHPLCGVSPIYSCGIPAMLGLKIQTSSTLFFENGAQPGGVLTAPGVIDPDTASRAKQHWEENFTGVNVGRVAVLGSGLKYEPMMMTAVNAQVSEQLKGAAEAVCTSYHVPPYMIGVGPMPTYNNIEALNQQYYSQCLQLLIESIELLLDEGVGLDTPKDGVQYGTEFDVDALLRMDTATRIKSASEAMASGMSPNEVRRKFHDLGPVTGGSSPMLQQQNFSLEALAKRDAKADPFGTTSPPPAVPPRDAEDPEADPAATKGIDDLETRTTEWLAQELRA